LEITLNKKNNTEGLIKIIVTEGDYQPKVEEKVKDYARKATIKGFRQGKVPAGVIKKMYGKSILVEEINHLISHKLSDYIKENNLKILGEPLPDQDKAMSIDWDTQKNFEFDYEIGMVDDFDYELSSKVKVKSYPIEVDQKVIDETVSDLKKRFGKVTYPETSEAADNLFGELRSLEIDFKKEHAFIGIENVEKKEQKKFIGLKVGDEVEFEVTLQHNSWASRSKKQRMRTANMCSRLPPSVGQSRPKLIRNCSTACSERMRLRQKKNSLLRSRKQLVRITNVSQTISLNITSKIIMSKTPISIFPTISLNRG
jgi:FKBP-type peptidyl-prolyl cis-trans isomerase (trigger factor)